ncbi:hypothetical protein C5167_047305 [Papaver somniferum]|uniref:Uncharacterized protein n=1 Tax=Papaver somniferum TaxID=3469 RepID=A0A4Y7LGZ2_PAPSO|nr:hypothetical protein C5167_047305 [Papaver somniferum]
MLFVLQWLLLMVPLLGVVCVAIVDVVDGTILDIWSLMVSLLDIRENSRMLDRDRVTKTFDKLWTHWVDH